MQRDRARCFTFSPRHLGASLSCWVVWFAGSVGVVVCFDCTQVFCMAFAKSQLGLLLSLDHRRLDDHQSLETRKAVAQKKRVLLELQQVDG